MAASMGSMDVQDITGRASSRAVPPRKWAKLVADWAEREGLDVEARSRAVSAALLHHFSRPRPPALLVSYLSQALESGLLTARAFVLALLAQMHREGASHSVSTALLGSIASALLTTPTGLDVSEPLPSPVTLPTPDVGTSASGEAEAVPALSLVLPLLRQCVSGPPGLLALAARITSLIPPLPAPPFEAGLEAAQLSAVLPEEVAKPLRDCLTGLMADLPMPEAPPPVAAFDPMGGFGELVDGVPQLSNLPTTLPLRQMASFLIEYAERAQSWTPSSSYTADPPMPPQHLIFLLRLGRALTSDSQAYLLALLDAASARVVASLNLAPGTATRAYVFFTEELPVALRWWRDNADAKWPFPSNIHGALAGTFASHNQDMTNWHNTVNANYAAHSAGLMDDDESGGYTPPEGWGLLSLETTTTRRYLSLGLLDEEQAMQLSSEAKVTPSGESLVERLSNSMDHHVDAISYFISYATGASRSLGAELVNVIKNAKHTPAPENLFLRVARSPPLLALVTAYITPKSLLDLIEKHLLDHVEDQASRMEDPQTSLTRFGPSVVLADALCAQFDLPLPDLLYDGRRASAMADLSSSEQGHLNGWVKALFGSDGIDDEIILATSSQGLCRLAPTIVQQAIVATMSGQIDLDTLHSGLSYFAQPILSWCLGGVVGWLCSEIERQGILSGVHLNVLQTLVLDSAFPEPSLRANAAAIARLLDPTTGLEAVMLSSNFDAAGVRSRIDAVGGPNGAPVVVKRDSAAPLADLRAELANIQRLDLAPTGWEVHAYNALDEALRCAGALPVLDSIVSTDILYPPSLDAPPNSHEVQFLAFVSVLNMPRSCAPPLAVAMVDAYLPSLFTSRSVLVPLPAMPRPTPGLLSSARPAHPAPPLPFAAHALHNLLRGALLSADAYASEEGGFADTLAAHLADEFACQRVRPAFSAGPKSKRAKGAQNDAICPEQKELICEVIALFEGDEEIRARWPNLTPLTTTS